MSWAEDGDLVIMHYFEMDESERGDPLIMYRHIIIQCAVNRENLCLWPL